MEKLIFELLFNITAHNEMLAYTGMTSLFDNLIKFCNAEIYLLFIYIPVYHIFF